MIETFDKQRLATITIVLDAFLLYVFTNYTLKYFDFLFIIVIFILHFSFYIALYNDFFVLLDYLHYSVFISLGVSIFLDNIWLLFTVLLLLVIIQSLWITEDKCILLHSDSGISFGYDKELQYAVLLYTVIISGKIGNLIN